MRDGGTVDLPATVSKAALLRDLEYYGFEDVPSSNIHESRRNSVDVDALIQKFQKELDILNLAYERVDLYGDNVYDIYSGDIVIDLSAKISNTNCVENSSTNKLWLDDVAPRRREEDTDYLIYQRIKKEKILPTRLLDMLKLF